MGHDAASHTGESHGANHGGGPPDSAPALRWEPPGRGSWDLDTAHATGAVPAVLEELLPAAVRTGFEATTARYGLPISHVEVAFVNHRQYSRMVAVAEPFTKWGQRGTPPPRPVLWLLARAHPELRRRARAAASAFGARRWRTDVEEWRRRTGPARTAANLALQDEPVQDLADDALAGHLRRAVANASAGITEHFDLVGPGTIPVGQLLGATEGWDLDPAAVLGLLRGSSPASSEPARLLDDIAAAVLAAGTGAGARPASLDDVRRTSAAARAALDAYLRLHGWRLVTAYEPSGRALVELPEVVLASILATMDRLAGSLGTDDGVGAGGTSMGVDGPAAAQAPAASTPARAGALRESVPAGERDRFDELLVEARTAYGLRDDNVGITFMWTLGLVRRALLEAGRRLADRGAVVRPADVMALRTDEVAALLTRQGGPGQAQVAERVRSRAAATAAGAPASIGSPRPTPPDLRAFPAPMVRAIRAFITYYGYEGADDEEPGPDQGLRGVGIGGVAYRGRARVVTSADDALATVEGGDVVVTAATTPAFNAVLSIAGALVTEQGGLLSHAALVARELGLPAVIGVAGALGAIPDGSDVEVDPAAGAVRIHPRLGFARAHPR